MSEMAEAVGWLGGEDTGLSSVAIMMAATGQPCRSHNYPCDPDDLGRCLRLIREFPWTRRGLALLAVENPIWANMVNHWEELQRSMEQEVGMDWEKGDRAPKTYELMQKLQS